MNLSRLRLSPAMAVACVALFISLGGVSYGVATGSIDSREIRNGSIQGKDIRNGSIAGAKIKRDSVGGPKVNESTLSKVPSAARADTAGRADLAGRADTAGRADAADSVGGATIRKVDFRSGPDVGFPGREILALNGLTLRAACVGPPGLPFLGVVASTTAADASLVSESRVPLNTDGLVNGSDDGNATNDDFISEEEVKNGVTLTDAFGTGVGDLNDVQLLTGPGISASGITGTTHFRAADGRGVVVHWAASDISVPCQFTGYAVGF